MNVTVIFHVYCFVCLLLRIIGDSPVLWVLSNYIDAIKKPFILFYLKCFCLFVSSNTEIILCETNPKTTITKVLTMPLTYGICSRRPSKKWKVTLKDSSRGSSICLASNKIPSSTPSSTVRIRKWLHEEKSVYELPAGSGEDYYLYP